MSAPTLDLSTRPVPPLGGFSPTVLRIELRRILRNRRTMLFSLLFPSLMFLFISSQVPADEQSLGRGVIADVGAYIMVSMAVYGAVLAATSAGASVSLERAAGWSRQLRLTPLSPVAYVATKVVGALMLGSLATAVVFVLGAVTGKGQMAGRTWAMCAVIVVVGALVFAAFGLFLGYVLPADSAMQFLGLILAILSILGGLFSAPIDPDSVFGKIAELTPVYGLAEIAHWPLTLTTTGGYDPFEPSWVVNLAVWAAVFVGGAAWRFSKDTARV